MVGEDTHISRLGGQVDLDDILGLVEGLRCWVRQLALVSSRARYVTPPPLPGVCRHREGSSSYLVREGQAELDLLVVAESAASSRSRVMASGDAASTLPCR